jgi:hypothetical protein
MPTDDELPPGPWSIAASMFADECFVVDGNKRIIIAKCPPAVADLLIHAREVVDAAREWDALRTEMAMAKAYSAALSEESDGLTKVALVLEGERDAARADLAARRALLRELVDAARGFRSMPWSNPSKIKQVEDRLDAVLARAEEEGSR